MRKFLLTGALAMAVSMLGASSAAAATIVINPDTVQQWTSTDNSNPDADDICDVTGICGLSLFYKDESGLLGAEDGTLADSYETTFAPGPTEWNNALIQYQGGPSIVCPECVLVVKDGRLGNPAVYFFNLGNLFGDNTVWNGTDDLSIEGFWLNTQGDISNVAIWSNGGDDLQVPEPGSFALFAFGLAALAARRRSAA